jgi:hypothetical protein
MGTVVILVCRVVLVTPCDVTDDTQSESFRRRREKMGEDGHTQKSSRDLPKGIICPFFGRLGDSGHATFLSNHLKMGGLGRSWEIAGVIWTKSTYCIILFKWELSEE